MKRPSANLLESPFGFHEFFFSVTDKKGVIRFGNDVFVRVSAYPKETMIGAPHSLIRHPDMPRAVFKEFWNFLNQGKHVGAYVKNLAGNGNYYWVYAFAFPIADGYLSIRFKPSSSLFPIVQNLYQEILQYEQAGHDLNSSHQYLMSKLQELGFANYEDFMLQAVLKELNSRTEHNQVGEAGSISKDAVQIAEIAGMTTSKLNEVFEKLRNFQEANQTLEQAAVKLGDGFQQLKFISINMKIAAAKFGEMAASLGVVSHEFSMLSQTIEQHLGGLEQFVHELSNVTQKCVSRVAALNIQMLMVDFFVRESIAKLESSDNAFAEMLENQSAFSDLFAQYCRNLEQEFSELRKSISAIEMEIVDVAKFVTGLEVIRQMGAIESSRTSEIRSSFTHYLAAMDDFIRLLRNCTSDIRAGVAVLGVNSQFILSSIGSMSGNVDEIFELASSDQANLVA